MVRDVFSRSSRFLFLLFAGLVVTGCGGSQSADTKDLPRVTVAHPAIRSLVDEDDYNGWLEPFKTVEIRSRVRGHIVNLHFRDGDIVKEKQRLFDLDPAPFEVQLKQLEAQAKALKAQATAAKVDAERYKSLVKKNAASQQETDKAIADAESFDAQNAAKNAEAERCKLDLEYAKIKAPLSGRISKAAMIVGDLVNAGGTDPLLTTIVAIDPIYVDFNVDERAIQRYQAMGSGREGKDKPQSIRDQKIPFSFGLDTEQGFPRKGQLVFADNKYDSGTGTILLRGEASNPDGRLIAGSRVRVRVPVSDKYEAVVVPDTAVLSDQDRKYLLVLGKDNQVLRRDIVPGRLLDDGMRVVLPAAGEDKAAGNRDWTKNWESEWVITVGLQRARVNYPVTPLDAAGQPIGAAGSR